MVLRIADLFGEGDGVFRFGQTRHAVLPKRVEIVDLAVGEFAQPFLFRLVVVAVDADPQREIGEDVDIVAALIHRLDRLFHIDRVMAGARPGQMDVVAFPEGRRRQYDVRVADGRGHEMVLSDDEFDIVQRVCDFLRIRRLIEDVAAAGIDQFDVGRIAAFLALGQEIREQRCGDLRVDRVLPGRQTADAHITRCAVADAGIAADYAGIAGDRG